METSFKKMEMVLLKNGNDLKNLIVQKQLNVHCFFIFFDTEHVQKCMRILHVLNAELAQASQPHNFSVKLGFFPMDKKTKHEN